MSTIVVLKDSDTLVLATDSRFMKPDFSGIASDKEQKIFEIAPATFIATSGRKMACDFQVARARELANELATTDIRAIGAALERESLPCLTEVVECLRLEPDETTRQAVSGESLLHGCVLVGRTAGGNLGFVFQQYMVRAGVVECQTEDLAGQGPRKIMCSSGAPPHALTVAFRFTQDPTIWTDTLERVARRILRDMRQATITSGGPDQVVILDARGAARWICPPPKLEAPVTADLTAATISVAVSLTSPTITVSGSGWTVNLDATHGFKVTNNTNSDFLQMLNAALVLQNSGGTAFAQFDLRHPGGSDYGEVSLGGTGGATLPVLNIRPLSGTAVGASGAASALPANPRGYLNWDLGGTTIRIPYYN